MSRRVLDETRLDDLRSACGGEQIEVLLKRGRTRRLVREGDRHTQTETDEQGWAIRASTSRGSFFACGTGEPDDTAAWPEPDGYPLRLPEPVETVDWTPPPHCDAPLVSESELRALGGALIEQLEDALPGARVDLLSLEDGQSETRLGNTFGILAGWRTRAASVVMQASIGESRSAVARLEGIWPALRELSPRRLAVRLADLLSVESEGKVVARDRSDVIVAPPVGAALLAGLMPLFREASSAELLGRLADSDRLGSEALTVVDDGRLAVGVLSSPVDGEGTPTQRVALIERGVFRQPLLPWSSPREGCLTGGCSRRDSWRSLPAPGPSHLYVQPDAKTRAGDLVSSLARGYYLLAVAEEGRFDFAEDRFELPVGGFEIASGRASSPVTGVVLSGRISGLLHSVRSVARDLTFSPRSIGLVGSPTLRLTGLELRQARG